MLLEPGQFSLHTRKVFALFLLLLPAQVDLPLEIDQIIFQSGHLAAQLFGTAFSGEERLLLQQGAGILSQLREDFLLGDLREIPLQQIPPLGAQNIDEVLGIEHGEEQIPLPEHYGEICLLYTSRCV